MPCSRDLPDPGTEFVSPPSPALAGRFYMCTIRVCSVMSNSLQPYGLQPARPFCSWTFSGKNIGVSCHFLLQGIFATQGSNPHLWRLLHQPAHSLPLCHLGSPICSKNIFKLINHFENLFFTHNLEVIVYTQLCVYVNLSLLFYLFLSAFPFGSCKFVFCVCGYLSVLE